MNSPLSGYPNSQLDINFDICESRHRSNKNSEDAFHSRKDQSRLDRVRILDHLASHLDGATCDELEVALGLKHQSCSARCAELKTLKLVFEDGGRNTRSGRRAAVLKRVK